MHIVYTSLHTECSIKTNKKIRNKEDKTSLLGALVARQQNETQINNRTKSISSIVRHISVFSGLYDKILTVTKTDKYHKDVTKNQHNRAKQPQFHALLIYESITL